MCYWSFDVIFKAKQSPETEKANMATILAAILKGTSLKINRLLPIDTNNMYMKFEIEIPKQALVMLQKACHLQSHDIVNPICLPGGHFESGIAENQ